MFALYHLNSSYRSCQEWNRWGTKAELKKICVIVWCFLRRQTERRGLFFCFFCFFSPCKQISKSKASAPVSHTDRWRPSGTSQTKSSAVSKSTSQSGLPPSFLRPNRAVSQMVGRENGSCFPRLARRGRLLNRREREEKRYCCRALEPC